MIIIIKHNLTYAIFKLKGDDAITSISITKARANLYQTVSDVNEYSEPITITNNRGKNAVLISEDDWLVGNLSGFYPRRINIQHRLVYEVYVQEIYEDDVAYEGIVKVARMWTRYDGIRKIVKNNTNTSKQK